MEHLITASEVKNSGRPIGKMVDEQKLTSYISETEQLQIKPVLGDSLFLTICMELDKEDSVRDSRITTLLNGGEYIDKHSQCENEEKYFNGLKVTISYFVYAQNLMSGDYETTRFGTVLKTDDYSTHITDKQRSDDYNNVMEIANAYLKECVAYCKAVGLIKSHGKSKINFGGISIKKIG